MAKKITFLSPGIEINEVDQSFIPAQTDAEGPIIIGRSRKGPANMPVKVKSLEDFVSIFGTPVPGGLGQPDIWRNGNTTGTTFASYAAQAWLASEESPVTFVRLAGEHSSEASADSAKAGWKVGDGMSTAAATNATAYGLFLCDDSDAGQYTFVTVSTNSVTDAYTLTLNDGVNSTVTFEVDTNDSVTETDTLRKVAHTGTAAQFMANFVAKVEEALADGALQDLTVDYTAGDTSCRIALVRSTGSDGAVANAVGNAFNISSSGTLTKATAAFSNGALAAIFYSTEGGLALNNTEVGGVSPVSLAGHLVQSSGPSAQFELISYDANGTAATAIPFNFDRSSSKYIRNVFNTNPQLTNSANTAASNLKTYWLGESFKDHVDNHVGVSDSNAGEVYAILLPLGSGITSGTNYGYQKKSASAAKSGWVIGQKPDQSKLFRLVSLHVGEEIQKSYVVTIEDISEPVNPSIYNYATFTVAIRTVGGSIVEKYTNCTLDANSTSYVAQRIGDQYFEWSESRKKFELKGGSFKNQSDLFYVEMSEGFEPEGTIPVGFHGPVRPKGFGIVAGETVAKTLDLAADFTGSIAQNSSDATIYKGNDTANNDFAELGSVEAVAFVFPKLRMRVNGTDGGAPNQPRSMWGIRPKLSSASTQHDPDYCDYVRGLPEGLGADSWTPSSNYEYSFTFTLEDLIKSSGNWSWVEGSYDAGTSGNYLKTGTNDFSDMFGEGARQFAMPVWGGFDGFDITYMEPMANALIGSTLAPTSNYVDFTISKALDSISDSEAVPANLLVAPGFSKPSVTNKMISIAEARTDMLAIIDLEGDYTTRFEGTAESQGTVTSAISSIKQRNLNSSYGCAFYPWVQIADNLNGSRPVWVPASVAALGAFAKSQSQTDVWFAPAGFNRGGLGNLGGSRGPRVIQAKQRLDSKDRDLLYEVNINPIATFPSEGVVIFGQKTLQADSSALDRINVRRLLIYLKSKVNTISKGLLFDPNLDVTWNRFKAQTEGVMSDVRARFGLSDYKIVLDETTTTADLVDQNIMYAKIFIKPARAIEYIVVDFVVTKTGADFV